MNYSRADLRKMIYLACREECTVDDIETIKQTRDDIAVQLFGKIEKELTNQQMVTMLNRLNSDRDIRVFCTRRQANYVRDLAFEFAVFNHDYSEFVVTNAVGDLMSAEDIKAYIQERYKNEGFRFLEQKYKIALWERTANPKSHEFLISAGFREPGSNNKSKFYYEKITSDEADYLIRRYRKMNYKIKQRENLGVISNVSSN